MWQVSANTDDSKLNDSKHGRNTYSYFAFVIIRVGNVIQNSIKIWNIYISIKSDNHRVLKIRNTNQFVRIKKKKNIMNIKQNRILWILNKIWFTCYCDINIVRFIPRKDTEWWLTNMIWWWLTATEDLTKIRLYFLHQFTKYPKIEILQRIRTAI